MAVVLSRRTLSFEAAMLQLIEDIINEGCRTVFEHLM